LNEYGGISIDTNMALSEDIKWIETIVKNKLVNQGSLGIKPQIVGFYRPEYVLEDERSNMQR
jgi:hypothetical protein